MEYLIICTVAFITAGLTLFSGFGLGTILMPVFALFFAIDVAVVLTAIVHFANNLFKLVLMGKYANKSAVIRFGLPAITTSFLGAWLLLWLSDKDALFGYQWLGRNFEVTSVKLVIAMLLVVFALFEVIPRFEKLTFEKKYLPLGGMLSGFFGGLSGHQGALRSAFLIKCGLSKEGFIATGVVIACLVDFARISVYSARFSLTMIQENSWLLLSATVSAFLGVFIGKRLLKKVTMRGIQVLVAIMLFVIAIGLGSGIV